MPRVLKFKDDSSLNFKSLYSDKLPFLINTAGYYEALFNFETCNSVGRDDYYLLYIINGELRVVIEDREYNLKRGDAFILPPKCIYQYFGTPSTHYLYAHFTGSYVDRFLEECGFFSLPCFFYNDYSSEIHNGFKRLIDAFLFKGNFATQRCACFLQEILLDIFETTLNVENDTPLNTSVKYIHNNFYEKIEIPILAQMENLSNSRYIAVFKKLFGCSPNEYVIDLRLQLASSLLENTNMSIKQISERVGYSDQYFFSRLFKKHKGLSPLQYRKQLLDK